MSLFSGNKIFNVYINSANRTQLDKVYDFTIFFDNDELIINPNEGVNVNVVSFSMLNSMYNVNQYSSNNTFILISSQGNLTISIPYGNYNVYSLMDQLNRLLSPHVSVSYNVATNTYTYCNTNLSNSYSINPLNCGKLLGLSQITSISAYGTTSGYVNMVNYQQVILKCPTLVFENNSMDNIQDKNNFIAVSDFLYWINKQDTEPFKMINYKNEDCSTVYSYNVINRHFSSLNFKLVNEFNQPIYDAPDFLLQLQINVFDKDNNYFKEASLQALKLLNDIYFAVLNIISIMVNSK